MKSRSSVRGVEGDRGALTVDSLGFRDDGLGFRVEGLGRRV